MTLVDTSVWIEHLRDGNDDLREVLNKGSVLIHPFVIGEIACGRLRNRSGTLGLLKRLPSVPMASDDEVLLCIAKNDLGGRGMGYIDAHLLASLRLARYAILWTKDKVLARVAAELTSNGD